MTATPIDNNFRVVYMLSDTMSAPTQEMREAMFNAVVGDDERHLDPTIKALEKKVAELTGMEASLFMPSGSMSNLTAAMVHCPLRHQEIMVGDESDFEHCEQAAIAQVASRPYRTVPTSADGTIDLTEIERRIRPPNNDHFPVTRLICIENTNNRLGGVAIPLDYLKKLREFATKKDLKLHMDGARVWNAAVYLKVPLKEIAQYVDSISFCIYKGLGAPAGSMLSGSKEFIQQSRYVRKMLGGAQRKTGFLAAAGMVALDRVHETLENDHKHARMIAEALHELNHKGANVDMDFLHSNCVSIRFNPDVLAPNDLKDRLSMVTKDELQELGRENCVKVVCRCHGPNRLQLNVCNLNDTEQVQLVIKKLQFILKP